MITVQTEQHVNITVGKVFSQQIPFYTRHKLKFRSHFDYIFSFLLSVGWALPLLIEKYQARLHLKLFTYTSLTLIASPLVLGRWCTKLRTSNPNNSKIILCIKKKHQEVH